MNREDIGKLLGGYAANTLTAEEQQALFAAALEDQELFDALAKEQSLRDLLRDSAAKAQVLAALDQPKSGWLARWWRPAALGTASVAAAILILVAVYPRPHATNLVAIVRDQPPVGASRPEAAPPSTPATGPKAEPPSPRTDRRAAIVKREKEADTPVAGGIAGVVGGVPGAPVAPLAVPTSAPLVPVPAPAVAPPPPQAKQEVGALAIPQIFAEAKNRPQFKTADIPELSARDLFRQNISSPNQFVSKDASAEVQQAQQRAAQAAQSASQADQSATQTQQSASKERQTAIIRQAAGKGGFAKLQQQRSIPPAAGPVGIRYTVFPEADSRSIRFEPNAAGRIAVWARPAGGAWRIVRSSSASMMMPITVKLAAGETEAAVWFSRDPDSRSPQEPPPQVGGTANLRLEGPQAGDTATYAASPDPSTNEIRFNITLN